MPYRFPARVKSAGRLGPKPKRYHRNSTQRTIDPEPTDAYLITSRLAEVLLKNEIPLMLPDRTEAPQDDMKRLLLTKQATKDEPPLEKSRNKPAKQMKLNTVNL